MGENLAAGEGAAGSTAAAKPSTTPTAPRRNRPSPPSRSAASARWPAEDEISSVDALSCWAAAAISCGRRRVVLGARRHLAHPSGDPLDQPAHLARRGRDPPGPLVVGFGVRRHVAAGPRPPRAPRPAPPCRPGPAAAAAPARSAPGPGPLHGLARRGRRPRGLAGQLAHLLGDDAEALAFFAGARGLDRGVERQHVGLLGDRLGLGDELLDLLRRRGECIGLAAACSTSSASRPSSVVLGRAARGGPAPAAPAPRSARPPGWRPPPAPG